MPAPDGMKPIPIGFRPRGRSSQEGVVRHERDLAMLEQLCGLLRETSLCGLGQTAPNPVATALRYFRDEFEAHVEGRCPAGSCPDLVRYRINESCIGCTLCAQACPAECIHIEAGERELGAEAETVRVRVDGDDVAAAPDLLPANLDLLSCPPGLAAYNGDAALNPDPRGSDPCAPC